MRRFVVIAAALIAIMGTAFTDRANAAVTLFTDATAYFAAAQTQTLQDFNSPISHTDTSVTYNDMVVSCSGTDFCEARFFGTNSAVVITGFSIFGSCPAPINFTLNSPVASFGIFIAGLGTVQG